MKLLESVLDLQKCQFYMIQSNMKAKLEGLSLFLLLLYFHTIWDTQSILGYFYHLKKQQQPILFSYNPPPSLPSLLLPTAKQAIIYFL